MNVANDTAFPPLHDSHFCYRGSDQTAGADNDGKLKLQRQM